MDWWNIKAEHTPYEWAMQRLMYRVCPFGERRADWRAAWNATHQLVASKMGETSDAEFSAILERLSTYLTCEGDIEDSVDLNALQLMKEKAKRDNGGTA